MIEEYSRKLFELLKVFPMLNICCVRKGEIIMDMKRFLDDEERIKIWPAKHEMKHAVLEYLADKFDEEVFYTEKEVNAIINLWHTFGDYFLLRRGLIDLKLICRTRDGMKYWKEKKETIIES
jgi:hypothetical protein